MKCQRQSSESGFAMLLVFLMAAAIGIMLYLEVPRVAFESQRNKEQLLVERGEQYKRAIQLFVRKNSRYPGTIDELESMNNMRYLRRRYPDPMTGKAEWRLVHVGPGGVFLDSVVNKPKKDEKEQASVNTFIGEAAALGATPAQGQQQNAAMRRRPSEGGSGAPGGSPAATGDPAVPATPGQNIPGQNPPGQNTPEQVLPGQEAAGATMPGQRPQPGQVVQGPSGQMFTRVEPYAAPGNLAQAAQGNVPRPNVPGLLGAQQAPGQTQSQQASSFIGTMPSIGAQPNTGQPVQPGQAGRGLYPGPAANSQTQGVPAYPTAPGAQGASPGFGQQGTQPTGTGFGAAQNDATRMIQQILTSPRPQGFPGTPNTGTPGGTQIGGGIAGVASTSEDAGIMIYNEHQKYNEWEFLYDLTKDRTGQGARAGGGVPGTPADKMGTAAGTPVAPGSPVGAGFGTGLGSGFGSSTGLGTGVGTGFGNNPSGTNPQPSTQPQTGFGPQPFGRRP